MVNILAFDTVTPVCSIGIVSAKGTYYAEIDAGQRHSESFMEAADLLMKLAGLDPADLDATACMKGPGSFTGLRVGFAAAKGICLALDIPLIAVPTLDCVAFEGAAFPGLVLPVLDAKQSRYFTALYRSGECLTDYLDASAGTVKDLLRGFGESAPILLTGLSADLLYSELKADPFTAERLRLSPGRRNGSARSLLTLAAARFAECPGNDAASGPLYLRKSDAEIQSAKPRQP
ncbi:MAG: tRNA (adenosine(37)-N6)-threonylcarbamoyltransferase complex dimerization subunit type 1 TsaB [Spirochaetaceae bacterium]|jgi:tRNA threonylcarbamoyladenosine biosynthesis protein TsaB|nr:tRNA (adenosine(37)-N6)-threonylcarbamoyltransferase complex dimerization subunit type 1 TsaB [Spirochaetaceae bacterium]